LTCNHDPLKALCDPNRGKPGSQPQRTPSQDRCHSTCANISRTDTQIERIQAEDAAEVRAITEAMIRLLVGVPLRSDGQLTIKSLAEEAGLRRNKLTHKHTGLKDLFYALVRSQHHRPKIADRLQADNERLRQKLADLRTEHTRLKDQLAQFARVIHVLKVENQQLREVAGQDSNVRVLHRPCRA
jgi:ribonuclease HI